MMSWIIVILR